MRIAVTTPTGHIGRKVAERLLDEGAEVVLLARDAEKVKELLARGARAAIGSLDDPDYVVEATRWVNALFWVTPPNMLAADLRGFQNDMGRSAARAVRANAIPRVVNLSSIGAQLGFGAGPVNGLFNVEHLLDEAAPNITHLRPGYFFENYLHQADSISSDASIFLPVSGECRLPMIATRDIARAAVDRLLDAAWTGRSVRGLHGPADLSFDQAAGQISQGTGLTVRHVHVSEDDARKYMELGGISPHVAETMLEMFAAIESGTFRPAEPRTPETTTPTPLARFAREALAPLLTAPVTAAR